MKFIESNKFASIIAKLPREQRDEFFEKANRSFFNGLQETYNPFRAAMNFHNILTTSWVLDPNLWFSVCKAAQQLNIVLLRDVSLQYDSSSKLEKIRLELISNTIHHCDHHFVEQTFFVSQIKQLSEEIQRLFFSEANEDFYETFPQLW